MSVVVSRKKRKEWKLTKVNVLKEVNKSSLRDLAYVFFRRKWVIAAVVLSTVIPVSIHMFRIPRTYKATASLLVKPGRENIYVAPVGAPEGAHPPIIVQRVDEVINSEIRILVSRVLISRLVEQMGAALDLLSKLPDDPGATAVAKTSPTAQNSAVEKVLSNLSAQRAKDADLIEVSFVSPDPDLSANVITGLLDLYLERHLEVHRSGQSYDFFKTQSAQLEQKLASAARRLADFRKKYSIISFEQRKEATLEQYMAAISSQKANDADIKSAQKKIEKLSAQLTGLSEHKYLGQAESTGSPAGEALKQQLALLELERTGLLHKFKPEDHNVIRVNNEIAKVKEMLAEEEEVFHGSVSTGLSSTYEKIETELLTTEALLETLRSRASEIEKQLTEYGQELERLGRLEPELRSLERAVSVHEQNYKLYLTKFEESRVSDAMDAARMVSVSVLEPAVPPVNPVPTNKLFNILVSLCIATVAGLGLAFLIEYFDHTFKLPQDVEEDLNVNLLGAIKDMAPGEIEDVDVLATTPKPTAPYDILKTNFMMHAREKGARVVSICSPTAGEGCSTVAVNLAAALTKNKGSKLILIDANLRRPSLHKIFGLASSPGLSDVIHEGVDIRDAIRKSIVPNLFVLTSGISPPNPAVIFDSPQWPGLIAALKEEFEWLIFDCAPANLYPDATVLTPQVDGIILVVRAEDKRAEVALLAKERFEEAGGKIVGAILNRRRYIIPEAVYRRLI